MPQLNWCQSVSSHASGAHTGEISAQMLKEFGGQFVIVGHSECRQRGESATLVAKKALAAIEAGLTPILCVGETLKILKLSAQRRYWKRS